MSPAARTSSHRPARRGRVAVAALVVGLGTVGAAGTLAAQDTDSYVGGSTTVVTTAPSDVLSNQSTSNQADSNAATAPAASASDLAFTGSDAMRLALIGGGAVAVGAGALAMRRRLSPA